jgi:hypothetical protein
MAKYMISFDKTSEPEDVKKIYNQMYKIVYDTCEKLKKSLAKDAKENES